MAAVTEPPQQFNQPSRKGKRAWRKNVNLTELQEGLEDVRDEIIKGGIIAEKPSSELFAFDTSGDKHIQHAYNKLHKPLKADEILAQRSAIPAVDTRKRPASRTTNGVLEPSSKRRRASGVSHREFERLKSTYRGCNNVQKDMVPAPSAPMDDLWAEPVHAPTTEEMKLSFLTPPKPIKEPKTLKQAPISLAANGTEIPAVLKPKQEASYNPQSTAYFEALTREGQKEVEAEKKRLREAEEERYRQEIVARAAAEDSADGLTEGEEQESAWEGIESDIETTGTNLSLKRPQRKTQAQRNKMARRKEAERKAEWETKMKERARQAAQVKSIVKTIEAQERSKQAASASAVARTTTMAADNSEGEEDGKETPPGHDDTVILRRRRFGKAPVPEPPLELVLPDELQDSLRLLKPEGNLLRDRFRSVLVRGKVETRRPIVQYKKARRTYSEKWTYKDWRLKA